jgi:hypothetical protein
VKGVVGIPFHEFSEALSRVLPSKLMAIPDTIGKSAVIVNFNYFNLRFVL